MNIEKDIRDIIFKDCIKELYTGFIIPEREGILSGADRAVAEAEKLNLEVVLRPEEGARLHPGRPIMIVRGTPKQMAMAEDRILGLLSKPSGIATAAKAFCDVAGGAFDIVCGSWKKVDILVKEPFRKAIITGGCKCRMLEEPMVYLDKNYVFMLGGIEKAMKTVLSNTELNGRKKVVQVKGIVNTLGEECWLAGSLEADYIYLDTGKIEDLEVLADAMQYVEIIPKIVFGGNVTLEKIEEIKKYPVDIVGVGRAIIDAPMLDMKFDVIPKKNACKCGHD